ncbi:hypothetical protein SUGI_0292790 [Cryptomeria japonica]|nr:hypothetical protein SUGI_0292790 [Cryptomeria japonica]
MGLKIQLFLEIPVRCYENRFLGFGSLTTLTHLPNRGETYEFITGTATRQPQALRTAGESAGPSLLWKTTTFAINNLTKSKGFLSVRTERFKSLEFSV